MVLDNKLLEVLENVKENINKFAESADINDSDKRKEFAEKFGIEQETVNDIKFGLDHKKSAEEAVERIHKNYEKISEPVTDWSNDFSKVEVAREEANGNYNYYINRAKYEAFVSTLTPEQMTPEVIDFLKEKKLSEKIYQKAIGKYASSITPEQMVKDKDGICKYLRENNYEGGQNPVIDMIYQMDNKSVEQEEKINELDNKIKEQSKTIVNQEIANQALRKINNHYKDIMPTLKSKIEEILNKMQKTAKKTSRLCAQMQTQERESLGRRALRKIKGFFKKEPLMLPSESLTEIQNELGTIGKDVVGLQSNTVIPKDENELTNEIREQARIKQQRNNERREAISKDENYENR